MILISHGFDSRFQSGFWCQVHEQGLVCEFTEASMNPSVGVSVTPWALGNSSEPRYYHNRS